MYVTVIVYIVNHFMYKPLIPVDETCSRRNVFCPNICITRKKPCFVNFLQLKQIWLITCFPHYNFVKAVSLMLKNILSFGLSLLFVSRSSWPPSASSTVCVPLEKTLTVLSLSHQIKTNIILYFNGDAISSVTVRGG